MFCPTWKSRYIYILIQWVWSLLQALFPQTDQWVSLYWSGFPPWTHQEHVALGGLCRAPGQFPLSQLLQQNILESSQFCPLTELNSRLTQLQPTPIRNSLECCTPSHSASQLRVTVHPYLRWIQQLAPGKPWGHGKKLEPWKYPIPFCAGHKPRPYTIPFCPNGFSVVFSRMNLTSYSHPHPWSSSSWNWASVFRPFWYVFLLSTWFSSRCED